MEATYDPRVDAFALTLVADGERVRTQRVADDVLLHFDAEDRLIELEILGASAHYPAAQLARFGAPIEWMTLAEAAREAGLSPATLRVQIFHRKLPAEKRGKTWLVSRAALWTYLENRPASGQRPRSRKGRRIRRAVRTGKDA